MYTIYGLLNITKITSLDIAIIHCITYIYNSNHRVANNKELTAKNIIVTLLVLFIVTFMMSYLCSIPVTSGVACV